MAERYRVTVPPLKLFVACYAGIVDRQQEGQIVRMGSRETTDRDLFLMEVQRPEQVPARIVLPGESFMAFIVWDCGVELTDAINALG